MKKRRNRPPKRNLVQCGTCGKKMTEERMISHQVRHWLSETRDK